MFTLRFIRHGGRGHVSFSAAKYSVGYDQQRADGVPQAMVEMTTKDDVQFEYVGPHEPFDVCYVTNVEGKTIDRIGAG